MKIVKIDIFFILIVCLITSFSQAQIEYMVFPQMLALSEVVWSDSSARNWPNFQRRLQDHYRLLQRRNVNYYRPGVDLEILANFQPTEHTARVEFRSEQYQPEIRWRSYR